MKSRAIKIIVLAICLVLVMSLFVGCVNGCPGQNTEQPDRYEDKNIGDFVVRFYTDEDYCEIKGTTEQGNKKRFLVIPAYIDGVRVESLGVYTPINLMDSSKLISPEIESDMLEKIYFESAIKLSPYCIDSDHCPNLKKALYPGKHEYPYKIRRSGLVHVPYSMCEYFELFNKLSNETLPANVSYFYNFENANNGGYYWIDDYDYGEKIEYIPNDPVRDGYVFGGWYKDADCTVEWDFDADTLPEEITEQKETAEDEFVEVTIYQETILYAKWIK